MISNVLIIVYSVTSPSFGFRLFFIRLEISLKLSV